MYPQWRNICSPGGYDNTDSPAMADRQEVSAFLLAQPRPIVLSQDSPGLQCSLTAEDGVPLELLVRGAAGRDVWIFSVSVCDLSGNTITGLQVIKVSIYFCKISLSPTKI